MNRLDKKFRELEKKNKKACIVYITAGDPSLAKTKELVFRLKTAGVDIIELGIPFSDPLADGPTIQAASVRALKNNTCLKDVISVVKEIRKKTDIPLVFMTYYNVIFNFGVEKFVKAASEAGVDGAIIPDLPPEEARRFIAASRKKSFATIFLLAPTSTDERIRLISRVSRGFIYYVSLTGVTGARKKLPAGIKKHIGRIKKFTNKPVCVGFGVSNYIQAKQLSRLADGVITGSALIKVIQKNLNKNGLVEKTAAFARALSNAIHHK